MSNIDTNSFLGKYEFSMDIQLKTKRNWFLVRDKSENVANLAINCNLKKFNEKFLTKICRILLHLEEPCCIMKILDILKGEDR